MNRLGPLMKYAVSVPVFVASWYFFFVSVHLLLNSEASLTRIVIGGTAALLGVLVSGYIMAPMLAEQIADAVLEHIRPVLDIIPGGRRRSDPPAEPPKPPEDQ